MARYTGPTEKISRRLGVRLHLKGERHRRGKSALERKPYPPGEHGQGRRRKASEYATQLLEKQKIRFTYNLLEKQFRNTYEKAARAKGHTGENLISLLERRLDMVVYRLGFAPTLPSARQLVSHRHIMVNGRNVNIPSFTLRPGDIVHVKDKSKRLELIHDSLRSVREGSVVTYLELDKAKLAGRLKEVPQRLDVPEDFNEQAVVELYSK